MANEKTKPTFNDRMIMQPGDFTIDKSQGEGEPFDFSLRDEDVDVDGEAETDGEAVDPS